MDLENLLTRIERDKQAGRAINSIENAVDNLSTTLASNSRLSNIVALAYASLNTMMLSPVKQNSLLSNSYLGIAYFALLKIDLFLSRLIEKEEQIPESITQGLRRLIFKYPILPAAGSSLFFTSLAGTVKPDLTDFQQLSLAAAFFSFSYPLFRLMYHINSTVKRKFPGTGNISIDKLGYSILDTAYSKGNRSLTNLAQRCASAEFCLKKRLAKYGEPQDYLYLFMSQFGQGKQAAAFETYSHIVEKISPESWNDSERSKNFRLLLLDLYSKFLVYHKAQLAESPLFPENPLGRALRTDEKARTFFEAVMTIDNKFGELAVLSPRSQLEGAIEQYPESIEYRVLMANQLFGQGRKAQAVSILRGVYENLNQRGLLASLDRVGITRRKIYVVDNPELSHLPWVFVLKEAASEEARTASVLSEMFPDRFTTNVGYFKLDSDHGILVQKRVRTKQANLYDALPDLTNSQLFQIVCKVGDFVIDLQNSEVQLRRRGIQLVDNSTGSPDYHKQKLEKTFLENLERANIPVENTFRNRLLQLASQLSLQASSIPVSVYWGTNWRNVLVQPDLEPMMTDAELSMEIYPWPWILLTEFHEGLNPRQRAYIISKARQTQLCPDIATLSRDAALASFFRHHNSAGYRIRDESIENSGENITHALYHLEMLRYNIRNLQKLASQQRIEVDQGLLHDYNICLGDLIQDIEKSDKEAITEYTVCLRDLLSKKERNMSLMDRAKSVDKYIAGALARDMGKIAFVCGTTGYLIYQISKRIPFGS